MFHNRETIQSIADLVSKGLTSKQIAVRLNLTENNVSHIRSYHLKPKGLNVRKGKKNKRDNNPIIAPTLPLKADKKQIFVGRVSNPVIHIGNVKIVFDENTYATAKIGKDGSIRIS